MNELAPKNPKDDGREEIVVIGGGLEGCLTTLMLARMKDAHGKPRYHITLLESQNELLNGSSLLASRLHLGGEYPLDPQTARDCLYGACIWKMVMPPNIYTDRETMKFTVSKKTHELALEQKKRKLRPDEERMITYEDYLAHYELIRKEYEHIVDLASGFKSKQAPQHLGRWVREKVEKLLFGSPKKEKFYKPLAMHELNQYGKGIPYDFTTGGAFGQTIQGGVQTQELGLNIPLYLSAIQEALSAEVGKENVSIKLNCKVHSIIEPSGSPSGPAKDANNQQFTVTAVTKEGSKQFLSNQVVQAAYDNNATILNNSGIQSKPSKLLRRYMLLLDLGKDAKEIQPIFRMLGEEEGAMLSPYNKRYAIAYLPIAAYAGGEQALNGREPGSEWVPHTAAEKKTLTEAYLEALKRRFPILEHARVVPGGLIDRVTVNFDQKNELRRHHATETFVPGHVIMNATKATLAPRCAIEAAEMVLAHSTGKRFGDEEVEEHGSNFKPEYILKRALEGTYSLSDIPLNANHAAHWANDHGLPVGMVDPNLELKNREIYYGDELLTDQLATKPQRIRQTGSGRSL